MHQKKVITNKVGMEILNLKVEYLNRLIEFKQTDTVDGCGIPIFGVNNVSEVEFALVSIRTGFKTGSEVDVGAERGGFCPILKGN